MNETNAASIMPKEVSGLDIAFGGDVKALMPPMETIPEEFRQNHTKWNRIFSEMFFFGAKDLNFTPKPGIDTLTAWRHVRAIMGSWEPQHEHKEAACAYLMSLWFEDITYTVVKP
jgi:maltooligosyltrehalose synthase